MKSWLVLLVLLSASAAHAQSKPLALIPQTNDACAESGTVGGDPVYGLVRGNRIAYCTTQTVLETAAALPVTVAIDGVSLGGPLLPTYCAFNGRKVAQCFLTVTTAILQAVAPTGRHELVLTDVTTGAGYEALSIVTGCPALNISVSPWVALPSYVAVGTGLGQSNQMLLSSFFASKALAERVGYVVDWSVQFFANTLTTTDRRFVVGARCVGVPQ